MLNQLVVVGKIGNIHESGSGDVLLELNVSRSYKNEKGEYDYDSIVFTLKDQIAKTTLENCENDDVVGIKGKVENDEEGGYRFTVEKLTFLSTGRKNEDEAKDE